MKILIMASIEIPDKDFCGQINNQTGTTTKCRLAQTTPEGELYCDIYNSYVKFNSGNFIRLEECKKNQLFLAK